MLLTQGKKKKISVQQKFYIFKLSVCIFYYISWFYILFKETIFVVAERFFTFI